MIEYAIRMAQFPQSNLLSEIQSRGELSPAHVDALAAQIARFHLEAPAWTRNTRWARPKP